MERCYALVKRTGNGGRVVPLRQCLCVIARRLWMQSSCRSALSALVRLLFTFGFTNTAIPVTRFLCVDFHPMTPNQPNAANPAIASRLHAVYHWRGVADSER
jgi:hypothetical protein